MDTFAFALAACAAIFAAAAWITSQATARSQASSESTMHNALRTLEAKLDNTASPQLRAELDVLAAALEQHVRKQRSELGKLWARFTPPADDKPELTSRDELRRAHSAAIMPRVG